MKSFMTFFFFLIFFFFDFPSASESVVKLFCGEFFQILFQILLKIKSPLASALFPDPFLKQF